jgi:hypothetical protein
MCRTARHITGNHAKSEDYNMFKVEVIADDSGKWVGNGLRFPTYDAAEYYATDLMMRWTAVREWRVVKAED